MLRIRNKSLDHIFEQFKVSDLYQLTQDQLNDVCRILKVPAQGKTSPVTRKPDAKLGFGIRETIEQILGTFEISMYMGKEYWNEALRNKFEAMELETRMKSYDNGRDVFEEMRALGVGVYKLLPGQSEEVDWSDIWIEEVLKHQGAYNSLEIIRDGKTLEIEEVKEDTKEETNEEVSNPAETVGIGTDYKILRQMAVKHGIPGNLPKDEMIKELSKKLN